MSRLMSVDFNDVIGKKLQGSYVHFASSEPPMFLLNFDTHVLMTSHEPNTRFGDLKIMTKEEWLRNYNHQDMKKYYPLSCFEDKKLNFIKVMAKDPKAESYELGFESEGKKIKVSMLWGATLFIDIEIIRSSFTINFGNKSILEVGKLLSKTLKVTDANISYVGLSDEVRKVYYYYSLVDNVFELASYITEIFNNNKSKEVMDRPKAFILANQLIYG